jgi:hypothetical protein
LCCKNTEVYVIGKDKMRIFKKVDSFTDYFEKLIAFIGAPIIKYCYFLVNSLIKLNYNKLNMILF